jgi:signal transduction histidine kinase
MSNRSSIFLLFILVALFSIKLKAENADQALIFSDSIKTIRINGEKYFDILEDKSGILNFSQITKQKFKDCTQEIPNCGVTSSNFWIKFKIKNASSKSDLLLELAQPTINEIEFYIINANGKIKKVESGVHIPFPNRKYQYTNYIFDLDISSGQTNTYYIKVKSGDQIMIPVSIGISQFIYESVASKNTIFGIYFGMIIVMALYNFFIYLTVKDKTYLLYVTYIILVGLTQLSIQGYTYEYLWPNYPEIARMSVYLLTSLTSISAIPFLRNFLQTKKYVPKIDRLLDVFMSVFFICILLLFLNYHNLSFQLMQIDTMLLALYLLFIGFKINKAGYRPARFFLVAWSIFLIGVFLFILKDFSVLPYNNFTCYIMPAGSAIEVILLSFALADRINILKKEKEESQAQALDALLQNELIIRNQNIVLENNVEERTKKLKYINEELYITLSELKQTQSQLVNSEKMASLGQLTAGIAHEINNPINFVVSNVKPLKRDIEEIYELINLYDTINIGDTNSSEKIIEVRKYRKEIDYDYLKQEISHMLKGIEDGAIRTAEIVKGLRVFSRLDENDLKRTDINEGINATLTLLNPEISGSIDLVKNFENLPKIECFPGKLNQVFMNILNNAIYAIKENTKRTEKGKLEITTTFDDQFVRINIKDNGIGMSEEVRKKIFDPFFTTKPVGKGTGLGMSITFSIINDHRGVINLHTKYSIGTEFIIQLPIDYKN